MKKEPTTILEHIDPVENYFIQLLFCRSRFLLSYRYRNLYDALFDKYKLVYAEGRKRQIDLKDINDKFINEL